MKNYSTKTNSTDEYLQDGRFDNKYHENLNITVDNILSQQKNSKELFTSVKMNNLLNSPIVSVEDFFCDEHDPLWQPLPEHDLEQSPCRPIIDIGKLKTMGKTFYRCKIHPGVWNIDLIGIEHHCRYQEPDEHKARLLELLSNTEC